MIKDIFKSPVSYNYLKHLNNKKISSYCLKIKTLDTGHVISNSGGYQSHDLQGSHTLLNELFNDIEHFASQMADTIGLKSPMLLNNAWINVNGYKDFNTQHIHPHSVLSGTYYAKTPKQCGNIVFHHPGYDLLVYDWNSRNLKDDNSTYTAGRWNMPAEAGKLIIFPSWLKHFVEPNLNKKEERISISFNLLPK